MNEGVQSSGIATPGQHSGQSLALMGRIAPEHANPDLVPRYASVPEWIGWILAFVSSIGGIFLGVALGPTSEGSPNTVKVMAQACASRNDDTCKEIALRQGTPPWLLWVGALLLLVSIGGYAFAHRSVTAKRAG